MGKRGSGLGLRLILIAFLGFLCSLGVVFLIYKPAIDYYLSVPYRRKIGKDSTPQGRKKYAERVAKWKMRIRNDPAEYRRFKETMTAKAKSNTLVVTFYYGTIAWLIAAVGMALFRRFKRYASDRGVSLP